MMPPEKLLSTNFQPDAAVYRLCPFCVWSVGDDGNALRKGNEENQHTPRLVRGYRSSFSEHDSGFILELDVMHMLFALFLFFMCHCGYTHITLDSIDAKKAAVSRRVMCLLFSKWCQSLKGNIAFFYHHLLMTIATSTRSTILRSLSDVDVDDAFPPSLLNASGKSSSNSLVSEGDTRPKTSKVLTRDPEFRVQLAPR